MNSILARLYGTGMSKTASDASAEAGAELDLNAISAADFLKLVEEHQAATQPEKTAGELDLSQMSAQELIELAEQVDAEEAAGASDATIEKMAQSGDLQYWDAAGRIMAHAYANELEKVSNSGLPEVIDVDGLTAEQALDLVENYGYELVKEAGIGGSVKNFLRRAATGEGIREGMETLGKASKSKSTAEAAKNLGKNTMKESTRAKAGAIAAKRFAEASKGTSEGRKQVAKGVLATGGLYGSGAAALGGAGFMAGRKSKKD